MEYASEIHRLLKLGPEADIASEIHGASAISADLPVALPYEDHAQPLSDVILEETVTSPLPKFSLKNLLMYPFIFLLAFGFFYTILNFKSITAQVQGYFLKPQTEVILGGKLADYYSWISGYFFSVGDVALLAPNNDIDKDSLSNMDEFIMRTNPTVSDSDSDGFSDGIEVVNSMNPWGIGAFSSEQRKLAENLDMIVVNNRVSYNVSQNQKATVGAVLGAQTNNFDLQKPGRLSIPRLNLQVPLIWSKDPADFEADLSKGVIHYPGTAMPGEQGTVYISGHSSDYIWKRNPFGTVFAKLNYLKPGDDIFVDVYGPDGKVYNFRYAVTGNAVYKPDDQTQFIDNSSNKINLSTCWPIGTSKDRLVVSAIQKPL